MAYLESLKVSGIRNLQPTKLVFGQSLNLIVGDNGSGKTSLLEAVYLLGRGRSFRTSHLGAIINRDQCSCVATGRLISKGVVTQLGVARQVEGGFKFRLNREPAHSASELAAALPLLLINSDSFSLLDGGPSSRRRYLDWALFHVEQNARRVMKKLLRILKQRNSLLRRGKIDQAELGYWDNEFSEASELVHTHRQKLFSQLVLIIEHAMEQLGGVEGVSFSYTAGWDVSKPLTEQLLAQREKELRQGRTLIGPHRAEIKITIDGRAAKEVLSRGQSKVLVSAMIIAQAKLLAAVTGNTPVALVDDLPAELDDSHRRLVIEALVDAGVQVFITSVDLESLVYEGLSVQQDIKVFHVERGVIVEQQTGLS